MHRIITLAVLLTIASSLSAQWDSWYTYTFDDTSRYGIRIDTADGFHGLWQIAQPQKHVFTSAASAPNAIMTDSLNAYPPNAHSSFTYWHLAGPGYTWPHTVVLGGYYWADCDTLTDNGTIEWSYDNGQTWIDILNDPEYSSLIGGPIPVLTGRSGGWQYFSMFLGAMVAHIQISDIEGPIFYGDTMRWRFNFASDDIDNGGDGLMYDDLHFEDWAEGIAEIASSTFHSDLWPNPAHSEATLVRETTGLPPMELVVRNTAGAIVLRQGPNTDHRTTIDLHGLAPGLYVYELRSTDGFHRSMGRFVRE